MHCNVRTVTYLWQSASCETGRQERTRRSNSSLRRERWSLDKGRMRFVSTSTSRPASAAPLFTITSKRAHREVKSFQQQRVREPTWQDLGGRLHESVARNGPKGFRSCGRSIGRKTCEVNLKAPKAMEAAAASFFQAVISPPRLRHTNHDAFDSNPVYGYEVRRLIDRVLTRLNDTACSVAMSELRIRKDVKATSVSPHPGTRPSENVNVLRNIIAQKSTRIDDLEIEVANLRDDLENALSHGDQAQPQRHDEATTSTGLEAELAAVRQQYKELETQHRRLQVQFERQELKVKQAMTKYAAAKESSRQWQAYINKTIAAKGSKTQGVASHESTSPMPNPPPSIPQQVSDIDTTPRPFRQTSPERARTEDQHHVAHPTNTGASVHPASSQDVDRCKGLAQSSVESKRISSSQTTEDDRPAITTPHVKHEEDSDEAPVVVRENNLRRHRVESATVMPPPRRIKEEPGSLERPGSAEQPLELRSDDWSSPTSKARTFFRAETSDLDAMRGTFQTPRKRKLREDSRSRAKSEERSMAMLRPSLVHTSSSLSDSDIPELPQLPAASERADTVAKKIQTAPAPKTNTTPKTRSHDRQRGALNQISPNVSTVSSTTRKRRRISQEAADKVSMLAEDGDETSNQITPKAEFGTAKAPGSPRLSNLLENPTPARKPLQSRRPTPNTAKRARAQHPQAEAPPQVQPQPMSSKKTPLYTSKYARPREIEKSPPPINPDSEPLRSKPKHLLKPQDFRINPNYAGSSFAFVQPMNRLSKADRRCLPSCIDPACCGEFLDAARNNLLPRSKRSDTELLRDMFGLSPEDLAVHYPVWQREDVIFQARAQAFANEHGRHRKTFARAATPPGYWRTGMPSTQEEEEDRRKADEAEKIKVNGMWLEAMKGGGRWRFKDE